MVTSPVLSPCVPYQRYRCRVCDQIIAECSAPKPGQYSSACAMDKCLTYVACVVVQFEFRCCHKGHKYVTHQIELHL